MLGGNLRYSFEKYGVLVISAAEPNGTDDANSKLTQQILAAVAQHERDLISKLLAGARRVKASLGGYAHGRPPFGYVARDGYFEPHKTEMAVPMLELRGKGKTLAQIADHLNARDHRPRKAEHWQTSSVACAVKTSHLEPLRDPQ